MLCVLLVALGNCRQGQLDSRVFTGARAGFSARTLCANETRLALTTTKTMAPRALTALALALATQLSVEAFSQNDNAATIKPTEPEVDCTPVDADPWLGGSFTSCCTGLVQCTEPRDPNSEWFSQYPSVEMCRSACGAASREPTKQPSKEPTRKPTPRPILLSTNLPTEAEVYDCTRVDEDPMDYLSTDIQIGYLPTADDPFGAKPPRNATQIAVDEIQKLRMVDATGRSTEVKEGKYTHLGRAW